MRKNNFLKVESKKFYSILFPALAIFLAFLPFILKGGFLGDFGDPIGQTIPNKFLLANYLKNGIFPLWNPYSFLGMPFLADMQAGAFYLPDIIFFLIFPEFIAYNFSVLLHLIFGATGIFLFSRKFSRSTLQSLALSSIFALTALCLSKIVYLNFLEVLSFLPWILLTLSRKKTSIALLALLTALMIFAGHPVAVFYCAIIIAVFIVFCARKNLARTLAGFALGSLIASIQIIPFIFLKTASLRDSLTYEEFIEGSLRFKDFLNLLLPQLYDKQNAFEYFIYFGTIAALCVFLSLFFIKKYKSPLRFLFFAGAILFLSGVILSLGDNIPLTSRALYSMPVFNLIRVPARYSVLFHFGAIFMLIPFLSHLFEKKQTLAKIICAAIIVNSIATPFLFLEQKKISSAQNEYLPELSAVFEKRDLNSLPEYFLSTSFFLFPNRHIPHLMPSVIGYNPMILKTYHDIFPVSPVGAFENPEYFTDLYDKFETLGLKYYIFPSKNFLAKENLSEKAKIFDFLKEKNWELLHEINDEILIFKNPSAHDFAYFRNKENLIEKIDFSPGEIKFSVKVQKDDYLNVNQIYQSDWKYKTNISEKYAPIEIFAEFLQTFPVSRETSEITLKYSPRHILPAATASILGLILLFAVAIIEKTRKK